MGSVLQAMASSLLRTLGKVLQQLCANGRDRRSVCTKLRPHVF